ncbi:nuclear transcription factor Y subunit gamma [Anopheles funestus]|uniref:Nuclear transcription factor Y subunit gamma n=1 Tax=Anopheles funestus TaxID=62324 RepID=A0A182RMW9_ANOFN|nr:nuclear transcription factor Y subunit gamma [Anopheles funestus]
MDTPKKPLVVAASSTIASPLTVITTSTTNTITSAAETATTGGKEKLTDSQRNIQKFWPAVLREVQLVDNVEPGNQLLPLARIKKIMKLDEDVKMISSDAPLLFAKAIEIFIQELTLRAWLHTEHNKRRTLQRSDIAMAITKYDQFDFLIDIVPRDEIKVYKKEFEGKVEGQSGGTTADNGAGNSSSTNGSEDMQYFFQLSQQHQKVTLQHATKGSIGALTNGGTVFDLATVIGATGSQQLLHAATASTMATTQQEKMLSTGGESQAGVSTSVSSLQQQQPSSQTTIQTATGQSIILANGSATAGGVPNGSNTSSNQLVSANQSLQLLQHVMTPTGEITQIPLNFIRTAGSGGTPNTGQPIFIQTAPMQAGPTIIHTGPTGVFLSANQLQQLQQQQQQHQQQQAQQQQQSHHHHQTQHQHQSQLQNNHQHQRD